MKIHKFSRDARWLIKLSRNREKHEKTTTTSSI